MGRLLAFNRRVWPLASVLALSALTVLSLSPLPQLPLPGAESDKLQHLAGYGLLMLPAALARPPRWWALAPVFLAWSGAIELIQPMVNRQRELADLAANAAGLGLGAAIGFGVAAIEARRR